MSARARVARPARPGAPADVGRRLPLVVLAMAAVLAMGCTPVDAAGFPGRAAVVAARAGTGEPAGSGCATTTLTVVAHEDDDLLFVDPDLGADRRAGACLVTIYATAGDAGLAADFWKSREQGAMSAYAAREGKPAGTAFTRSTALLGGHRITTATMRGAPVRLLFLHLPDGGRGGLGFADHDHESLQKLYQGTIPVLHTVDGSGSYTQQDLLETLRAAMRLFRPQTIRTLDYTGRYTASNDHSDHLTIAYFTYRAQLEYATGHRFFGYRGYGITKLPPNLTPAQAAAKRALFAAYYRYDWKVCPRRPTIRNPCPKSSYATWPAKRYYSRPGTTPAPNWAVRPVAHQSR